MVYEKTIKKLHMLKGGELVKLIEKLIRDGNVKIIREFIKEANLEEIREFLLCLRSAPRTAIIVIEQSKEELIIRKKFRKTGLKEIAFFLDAVWTISKKTAE